MIKYMMFLKENKTVLITVSIWNITGISGEFIICEDSLCLTLAYFVAE
jgi:hypothetical protein